MGNTKLELRASITEAEIALEDALDRIVMLEETILEPFDEKLTAVARDRFPDGEAVAVFGGVHRKWNAYIPLADEPMTKEMAEELAREYNERRLKSVEDDAQLGLSNGGFGG